METIYDTIILGGGPAGLTAGIYLARAKHSVLIINEGTMGGQMVMTHKVANYPGLDEISGYQLARTMKNQAKSFGCSIITGSEVTALRLNGDVKEIEIDKEDLYKAYSVIIATGGQPRSLGLESEEAFKGRGISYCATCDGDFYQDMDIIVVGGGNSALEEAVSLTQYARNVTIVHQFDHFQAYPYAVEEAQKNDKISFIMESEVISFSGSESLEEVAVRNNKTGQITSKKVQGAFILIGYIPNSDKFSDTVSLAESGEIITDEDLHTSVNGVFAAGDVRKKKVRQITTAVSDGTQAAISAMEYLSHRVPIAV